MPNIAIQKAREAASLPRQLLDELESIGAKIRTRRTNSSSSVVAVRVVNWTTGWKRSGN